MLTEARRIHRQRALAGDGRAGARVRQRAARRRWEFVRAHWWRLLVLPAIVGVAVAVVLVLEQDAFRRGLAVGGGIVAAAALLWHLVVVASGTAPVDTGAEAEQWTAGELRRLRRHGWRVVHNVSLTGPDVDHVLVGPGGVVAVETKWSSDWSGEWARGRVERAAGQAHEGARRLRLWADMRRAGVVDAQAVVVLWGGQPSGRSTTPSGATVLHGEAAVRGWASEMLTREAVLTPAQVEQAWSALEKHALTRDVVLDREQPRAPTPSALFRSVVVGLVGALAAVLLTATALPAVALRWSPLVLVAAVLLGLVIRRWSPARDAVHGWWTGWAVVTLLLLATAVDVYW